MDIEPKNNDYNLAVSVTLNQPSLSDSVAVDISEEYSDNTNFQGDEEDNESEVNVTDDMNTKKPWTTDEVISIFFYLQ